MKSLWTKRNRISSEFEFSIYVSDKVPLEAAVSHAEDLAYHIETKSEELSVTKKPKWSKSENKIEIGYQFKENKDPYRVILTFIPDHSESDSVSSDELSLSSIGVCVEFSFEFGSLRSAIIDLVAFADFIQESFEDHYSVKQVTNGKFIVSPIDHDLTMDDWVHKNQFEVSLLLNADNNQRSVRFHGNKAEITSPTTQIDDETVEYIRATLLNYYL